MQRVIMRAILSMNRRIDSATRNGQRPMTSKLMVFSSTRNTDPCVGPMSRRERPAAPAAGSEKAGNDCSAGLGRKGSAMELKAHPFSSAGTCARRACRTSHPHGLTRLDSCGWYCDLAPRHSRFSCLLNLSRYRLNVVWISVASCVASATRGDIPSVRCVHETHLTRGSMASNL